MAQKNLWALVLAAGDGTRLSSLTTDPTGTAVPKQFCSLAGGDSLLHDALARAQHIAPRERQCVIVAARHERWWRRALGSVTRGNIIVQPANRGTAHGILLAVLRILARDPLAQIVFLPSDHFVRDEPVLAAALARLSTVLASSADELILLGIRPEEPDPELGYIVPHSLRSITALRGVQRFVEKPPVSLASELIEAGALWNSFIFAARGAGLLALLRTAMPATVQDMETALARDAMHDEGAAALTALYETLPSVDFSRAVVEAAAPRLRVLDVPPCGWSDLGTPRRVAQALGQVPKVAQRPRRMFGTAFINLSAQNAQLSLSA